MSDINRIEIDVEYDDEGKKIDGSYVVTLLGECAYCFEWDVEYVESESDACKLAVEVSESTGAEIVWRTAKPSLL